MGAKISLKITFAFGQSGWITTQLTKDLLKRDSLIFPDSTGTQTSTTLDGRFYLVALSSFIDEGCAICFAVVDLRFHPRMVSPWNGGMATVPRRW